MKSNFTLRMAALGLMAAAATACSSDDGGGGGGSNMATYIQAEVDGQPFTTYELNGFLTAQAIREGSGDDTSIYVYGLAQNGDAMTITLTGITETGTYAIDGTEGNNGIGFVSNDVVYSSITGCEDVEGSVTVTFLDNAKIEGTFAFKGNKNDCSGSKQITEGEFRGTFETE